VEDLNDALEEAQRRQKFNAQLVQQANGGGTLAPGQPRARMVGGILVTPPLMERAAMMMAQLLRKRPGTQE
jgi:hypothetical protein